MLVDQFTDGVLDPANPLLGPMRDGGRIIANTALGCLGAHAPACEFEPIGEKIVSFRDSWQGNRIKIRRFEMG